MWAGHINAANRLNRTLTIFSAALLLLSVCALSHANEITVDDSQSVPDIRWQDVDENTHHLKDSNGKPRLLHFWAAWCFPCREELPDMLAWKKKNDDILVIPLSLDERMAQAKYFIKKYQLDMSPLLINEEDSSKLEIPALPYTIFISADGSYTGHFYGIAPWGNDEFTQKVRHHFKLD